MSTCGGLHRILSRGLKKRLLGVVLSVSCCVILLGLLRDTDETQLSEREVDESEWQRMVVKENVRSDRMLPSSAPPIHGIRQTAPFSVKWPGSLASIKRLPAGMGAEIPSRPLCASTPEDLNLRGEIPVNLTVPTWSYLEDRNTDLQPGGHWEPADCTPRHSVAIVVPYRDREKQLLLFLQHLHPFLKKQKLSYTIYVLEQISGKVFNRGLDRNIGFIESLKLNPYHECTMFHDVDLLPLDERNMYSCPDQPRHVCVAVNYINNFMPLYEDAFAEFGHVTFFRNDQYRMINGYSNLYLGWGAEDDDIHSRIRSKGMHVYRYPDHIAKYYGIPHPDESKLPRAISLAQNVSRFKLLNLAPRRMTSDGLSSSNYTILGITKEKLFTRIKFDVEEDKYAFQAIDEERLYSQLYGDLTEYWRKLDFIPPPFWWKNSTLAALVRQQAAQVVSDRRPANLKRSQARRQKRKTKRKSFLSRFFGFS